MKQNILKFKSLAFGICTTCMVLTTGCSESEYAKINTDPSTIAEGNPIFLFTQEQVQYQPFDYLLWYYDGAYTSKIVQAYSPSSSFNDLYNKLAELGGVGSQLIYVKRYENDIKATIDKMPANKAAQYSHLSAMANALTVYCSIPTSLVQDLTLKLHKPNMEVH